MPHERTSATPRYHSGDVRALRILLPLCLAVASPALLGHGFSQGDIRIEHPFATPASGGTGSVYLAQLRNRGERPERLLRAATPLAERVELQAMPAAGGAAQRFETVAAIELAPGADLRMRPGKVARLQLIGLKRALRDGDTFALTLEFERAGSVETKVYVQQPR